MLTETIGRQSANQDIGAWLYVDEIAHRTLNDYAFVLATLERAGRAVKDPTIVRALAEAKERLVAKAGIYRALCPPRDCGARWLDEELERLCADLSASGLGDQGIALTLCCEPVSLSALRCWQACLVVTELVGNCAKHAFCGRDGGEIIIAVRTIDEELQIVVSDNGRGGMTMMTPGRGMGIVDALVDELGGVVRREFTASGSIVALACPLESGRRFLVRRATETKVQ